MTTTPNQTADPLAGTRRLLECMRRLRGEQGCPWDKAQTHQSLLPYLLEEAHELLEVVETARQQPPPNEPLQEELGDVLLQVVFHCQIAAERHAFDFDTVADQLATKLEHRHPHVFGATPGTLEDPEAVRQQWHQQKMAKRSSPFEGIPRQLPALQRAKAVGERAARGGFEWRHSDELWAKLVEETKELQAELPGETARPLRDWPNAEAPAVQKQKAAAELELGDLLFMMVQLARWYGLDPEAALRKATRKMENRYGWIQEEMRRQGLPEGTLIPEKWEALWAVAKQKEAESTED